MDILRGPFEFDNSLTYESTEVYVNHVVKREEGNVEALKKLDLGKITENLDTLDKDVDLRKYNYGIKRNTTNRVNSKVKKEVGIVGGMTEDEKDRTLSYSTVNENLVIPTIDIYEDFRSDSIDDIDSNEYYIRVFQDYIKAFQRLEFVDLELLVVRALDGMPKAVNSLRELVEKYEQDEIAQESLEDLVVHYEPFKEVIENVILAKTKGYTVLDNAFLG
ncbi:hypothetical protein COF68_04690 [Bacillus toyonensis]|uniref:hypothetical protein n=1 Tax=Bacillus toyonensis TaxID=155322 RepID=UPI000BFE53A3|nr:hypothetical protein [Bacillus toyonensis]PHE64149.1 hypothetical protein COF68_04690 [Bacillus toyonensis]